MSETTLSRPRSARPVTQPDHPIQGGGYAMDLDFLKGVPVDGCLEVTGDEARAAARALARLEGIFAGRRQAPTWRPC